jgi:thioredoxin 1
MSKMLQIDEAAFDARVLTAAQPIAVLFSAVWCGPCRHFGPLLERVSGGLGDALSVVKVDVDDAPVLAARYGVRSVPTLIVLREGEVVARQVGTVSEPALRRLLAGV